MNKPVIVGYSRSPFTLAKKGQLNLFYYTAIVGKKVIYAYRHKHFKQCWEIYTNFTVGHHYDIHNNLMEWSRSFNFYKNPHGFRG